MTDSPERTPHVHVEMTDETAPGPGPVGATEPQAQAQAKAQGRAAKDAMVRARARATGWLEGIAPGHGNAIFFGIVGLVAGILIFTVGFWETLVLVILVLVGVTFGQWLDGDPRIWNALMGLIRPRD